MKKLLTIAIVLTITVATSIQAGDCVFNGSVDNSWFTPGNWNDSTVPTDESNVWLNTGGSPTVDATGAVGADMIVGLFGFVGNLTIDAGCDLTLSGITLVGNSVADKGSILNNGSYNTGTIYMRGESTLVNNGTLNTPGSIQLGDMAGSTSLFTNTGVVNVGTWFIVSVDSAEPAIFNMNGGLMVNAHMVQNHTGNGHSIINLNDGIISNSTAALDGSGNSSIIVDNGEMYIAGDHTNDLNWLISVNLITGAGSKTPYSTYDGTYTKLAAIPEPAIIGLISILGLSLLRRK